MTQHLKGWRVSAGDEQTVFDGDSRKLVEVPCGGMSGRTFPQAADCASLIAAAPELLEALEALLDEAGKPAEPITGKMTTHEFMLKANAKLGVILVMYLPAIKAAIAKARGAA